MGMDIKIRNACPDDLDAMVALLRDLFSIEADFTFDRERQQKGLELMLEDSCRENRCIKVAEANELVVGMCTIQLLISTAEGGAAGLVEDMVVDRRFRGMGVGRMLMGGIEEWAKERNVTRLQLLSDRANFPALNFYGRIGWYSTCLVCVRRTWDR
jgi:GNAT superfamily N-acetyltransferase